MTDASCVFCKIVRKEIPATIVHEDDDVVAFRDLAPQAPTHVLVIPKKHLVNVAEASPEDGPLLGRLLLAAASVARSAGVTDFRLALNSGAGAGQTVLHLHAHLLAGRSFAWPPG